MKKFAAAVMLTLVLAVLPAPAAADHFFPMNPGDSFSYSVSGHPGKAMFTVNSPVRSIANGKSYHVLVLFNPDGPNETIDLLRAAGGEVSRYDRNGVENRLFMEGPAGVSWEEKRLDGRIVRTTIEAIEAVAVPAGRYTG